VQKESQLYNFYPGLQEPGQLSTVKGYGLGFDSQKGEEIFLFSTVSKPALGPTQLPILCVPEACSLGVK
jgi:hypothetical protein